MTQYFGIFLFTFSFSVLLSLHQSYDHKKVKRFPSSEKKFLPSNYQSLITEEKFLDKAGTKRKSLFDHYLDNIQVNGNFEDLLSQIKETFHSSEQKVFVKTLIPLGRSLQRNKASFKEPRVVVAMVDEASSNGRILPSLKDRLFIGFSKEAETLEVISYNDILGRYEFQIVKNFRPGGKIEVLYPKRELCITCHKNQGPIFSKSDWSETLASTKVVKELMKFHEDSYQGVEIKRGTRAPNSIDEAAKAANDVNILQFVWGQVCKDAQCRQEFVSLGLQRWLQNSRDINRNDQYVKKFQGLIDKFIKKDLYLISSEIPVRDPFKDIVDEGSPMSFPEVFKENDIDEDFFKNEENVVSLRDEPSQEELFYPRDIDIFNKTAGSRQILERALDSFDTHFNEEYKGQIIRNLLASADLKVHSSVVLLKESEKYTLKSGPFHGHFDPDNQLLNIQRLDNQSLELKIKIDLTSDVNSINYRNTYLPLYRKGIGSYFEIDFEQTQSLNYSATIYSYPPISNKDIYELLGKGSNNYLYNKDYFSRYALLSHFTNTFSIGLDDYLSWKGNDSAHEPVPLPQNAPQKVMFKHCSRCHGAGNDEAPFWQDIEGDLEDNISKYAVKIHEQVSSGKMPKRSKNFTAQDKEVILEYIQKLSN